MRSFSRIAFVASVLGLALAAHAQRIDRLTMDFQLGDRGVNDVNDLDLVLLDEAGNEMARGTASPPRGQGWPGGSRPGLSIQLNREVKVRLIRSARIGLRLRAGGPVFGISQFRRVTLRSGTIVLFDEALSEQVDERRPAFVTRQFQSFDPQGSSSPGSQWELSIRTGGDDLRNNSYFGFHMVLRDGVHTGVGLTNLRGNSLATMRLDIGSSPKAFTDVAGVFLAPTGAFPFPTSTPGRYEYRPFDTDDFWDLSEATVRVKLLDGDTFSHRFGRFSGRLGRNSVIQTNLSSAINLRSGTRRPVADLPVRLLLLVDGSRIVTRTGRDTTDLDAFFTFSGRSQEMVAARRVGADAPNFGTGSPWNKTFFSSQLSWIYANSLPWSQWRNEINGIKLRLSDWPGTSGGRRYMGGESITIRGWMLVQDQSYNNVAAFERAHWDNQFALKTRVLGFDFSRSTTLDRRNPEATLPVRYTREP